MREIEHSDLFTPPKGVRIVVIPISAETWSKGATQTSPMKSGYAAIAKTKWHKLDIVIGILQWNLGPSPHPLTMETAIGKIHIPGKHGNMLPPRYHMVSLPTRPYVEQPIKIDYLTSQLRALRTLCDEKLPWLKTGDVVLPQICDKEKPWEFYKPIVQDLLPDRYVVISGKPGTVT